MPELIGTTLGDFRVEGLLGRGSMASVYQAQQLSVPRRVALKVLKKDLFTPGESVTRFLREIESLARLEHPHIVPIYGAGRQEPYHYLAMRLVRQGTLAQAMQAHVSPTMALRWGLQLCKALAHAHAAGVVHRDLKPSNLLLQDGSILLGDFGLARLRDLSTLTQGANPLGTPLYMAPEQTRGMAATYASDCFALGVILFELLTGRHPFAPEGRLPHRGFSSVLQLFERIQSAPAPLEDLERLDLPPAAIAMLSRALEKEPARRYPDARAMLEDYAALQEDPWAVAAAAAATPTPPASALPAGGAAAAAPQTLPASAAVEAEPQRFGRYRILRELGHGGQGVVYEAVDGVLDRRVALKVLQRGRLAEEELQERFIHEARVAASLGHPNIIQIYEFGVEGGAPFLTMPLLDGPSLDVLLERRERLPQPVILALLEQMLDALDFAHHCGVLHLDVKPGNLVLGRPARSSRGGSGPRSGIERPHVVLTDFTMARVVRGIREEAPGAEAARQPAPCLAGTLGYAAPELLDPAIGPLGPAADFYSVGVVLHELLTGEPLHPAGADLAVHRAARASAPAAPSLRGAAIPPLIDQVCQGLLQRDPRSRLSRLEDVLEVVAPLLA